MGNIGSNFIENFGLILGLVLLGLFFLLIGRNLRVGRLSGRNKSPKWQNPGQPERAEQEQPHKRIGWGRGSRGRERKHEKDADHPGRGRKD